jgi:GH24 family phage-related lysozyme (muramidase)
VEKKIGLDRSINISCARKIFYPWRLDAQGALISLVYNRGTSMFDKPGEDRRKEMRAIRDAVAVGDLQEIANQLRSMERLWEGKGLDGLIKRREDEAALVESSIGAIA